jgi:hypothetical protein
VFSAFLVALYFIVLSARLQTEQTMFRVFVSMGIHLVRVSFAAADVAKRFPRLLPRYAYIDHARLVATGFLLGFFLERKKEKTPPLLLLLLINWIGEEMVRD